MNRIGVLNSLTNINGFSLVAKDALDDWSSVLRDVRGSLRFPTSMIQALRPVSSFGTPPYAWLPARNEVCLYPGPTTCS